MLKIITTVGTSIFTNYQRPEVRAALGRRYVSIDTPFNRTTTTPEHYEVPASAIYDEGVYSSYIRALKERISNCWFGYPNQDEPNKNASAEISSILKIAAKENEPIEVHLVATDTLQSVLAAELIVDWFSRFQNKLSLPKNFKVLFQRQDAVFKEQKDSAYVVKNLRLRSQENYRIGFMNLIGLLDRINIKGKTRLNITGGFKGLIPILTLFSQLFEVPMYYLYEEEGDTEKDNLITLGNLPIHFDLGYIENYVKYIGKLDALEEGGNAQKMYALGLLESINPPFELSVIGKLIKKKLESEDLPFHKTTLGYLIEYKIHEYYQKNKLDKFDIPFLGYSLSNEPGKEMEDADLWFENESEVIIAEIKPAGIKKDTMRKKIDKIFGFIQKLTNKKIKEFWIILYALGEDRNIDDWASGVFNDDFLSKYRDVKFCIKYIKIAPNVIDGDENRIRYHKFMRSPITEISDVCEKKYN